jgi:hypothetical protein
MQNRYGKQTEFSGATIGNRRGTPEKIRRATLPESIRTCRNVGETLEIMSKTYRNTDEIQWGSHREPLGDPVGNQEGDAPQGNLEKHWKSCRNNMGMQTKFSRETTGNRSGYP